MEIIRYQVYNFGYFPAEPTAVALYLQHIIETTKSYHAVDAAYYAINWAHDLAGLASCSKNFEQHRLIEKNPLLWIS